MTSSVSATPSPTWARAHAETVYIRLQLKFQAGGKVDSRYLSYLDPNHPLLLEFEAKAFGTFRHCVIVGSLAARAAKAEGINANPDLARAIGYYHDVEKMNHPHLFIETRAGIRGGPDPVSEADFQRILAHPRESRRILEEHRFPAEVFEAVEQHHGNMLSGVKLSSEAEASMTINQRHYPGPIPNSLESAIVMLADKAQATFERLSQLPGWQPYPSRDFIRGVVTSIGLSARETGQFENISLPLELQQMIEGKIMWALFKYYNELPLDGEALTSAVIASSGTPHQVTPQGSKVRK